MQSIRTLREFWKAAEPLVNKFDAFAKRMGLVDEIAADHIGFKCCSSRSFALLRALLEAQDVCEFSLLQFISERRIAYVRVRTPLVSVLGPIHFIELADQKPDNSQVEGFDHIEAYPRSLGLHGQFEVFLRKNTEGTLSNRPHHRTFDVPLPRGGEFRLEMVPLIQTIRNRSIR